MTWTWSVQVIYGLYSAVPPSLWFDPEHPFAFALMACLVLGLSVAAATLHKGLLAVVLCAAKALGQALSASLHQSILTANTTLEHFYDMLSKRIASSVKEHIWSSQPEIRRLACESMSERNGDRHTALQAEGALSLQSRATVDHLQQLRDERDRRAATVAGDGSHQDRAARDPLVPRQNTLKITGAEPPKMLRRMHALLKYVQP